MLKAPIDNSWRCFECDATFSSSNALQNHLNIHDDDAATANDDNKTNIAIVKNEDVKPRTKKYWKSKRKSSKLKLEMKCKICNEIILSQANKTGLRQHLIDKHKIDQFESIHDHFNVIT